MKRNHTKQVMSQCKEIIQNKLCLNVKKSYKQVMSECKEIIQNMLCLNVKKSYKTCYI